MLTKQDIKNLIEAMKEVFPTREEVSFDIAGLKRDVDIIAVNLNELSNTVDSISKRMDDHHSEILSLNYHMGRAEKKLGII